MQNENALMKKKIAIQSHYYHTLHEIRFENKNIQTFYLFIIKCWFENNI